MSGGAALSRPQADLAELLDRTLGAGVVVAGDLTLSLAGVELVYLNLRALLASVATLEAGGVPVPRERRDRRRARPRPPRRARRRASGRRPSSAAGAPATAPARPKGSGSDGGGDADERLERGLAQLVLTVVELLRRLMERQAIRRVEAGTLEPERVERLGQALDRLERELAALKDRFEFDDDDLTLRLGPLAGLDDDAEPGRGFPASRRREVPKTRPRRREERMASLKDTVNLTSQLTELTNQLHGELTEGEVDFEKMVTIADEISEHADNLAAAFTRVNEALMEPLDQNAANGSGETPPQPKQRRRRAQDERGFELVEA